MIPVPAELQINFRDSGKAEFVLYLQTEIDKFAMGIL